MFAALDSNEWPGQRRRITKFNGDTPTVDATEVLKIENKDGQISLAEHRTATIGTFDQVDANKDGMLPA